MICVTKISQNEEQAFLIEDILVLAGVRITSLFFIKYPAPPNGNQN